MSVSGIGSLSSLLQYNQSYATSLAKAKGPAPSTLTSQESSNQAVVASLAPTDTTLFGAVAVPLDLYNNISTLATLNAVETVNGKGQTSNGQPILPLGTAAEAAATGRAYQAYNQAALIAGLNLSNASSRTVGSLNLPSAYYA